MEPCQSGLTYLFAKEAGALYPLDGSNPSGSAMKLVSINVELNKNYSTVFEFLKKENPDVVCVQELLEEDFDRFKNELNMEGIFQPRRYFKPRPR